MTVQRGSDKHGPMLDDEMAAEVESLTRGDPVESRAQEEREKEPPGEYEPTPDVRVSGDRGTPPGSMTADEVEARSELARFLEPAAFPGDREALRASATRLHAPDAVLAVFDLLPGDETYENLQAVWVALGGTTEQRT